MPPPEPARGDDRLKLLHRDNRLVAIDKPAGLLVHRTVLDRHETRFAVQMLRNQIGQPVHPVHRLDRGTSGALLFALDRDTARHLSTAFADGHVTKTYLAVVRGWPAATGCIDHPLRRQPDEAEWIDPRAELLPQAALTRWRRLATAELPLPTDRYATTRVALLELNPETGRRHQIRRHLKHIAHPIIGDATHGKGAINRSFAAHTGCARLLLHCRRLDVPMHDGTLLAVDAPLSGSFASLLAREEWSWESEAEMAALAFRSVAPA